MSRRNRYKRRARARGHPIRKIFAVGLLVVLCAGAIGVLTAVGWVVSVADSAPNLNQLTPKNPQPLAKVYAADGSLLGYIPSDTVYDYVAPNQIPNTLKEATVAIEDRRFWQHGALDYQGIVRAGIKDLFSGGDALQGASTLTMQLVNNMYLDGTKYDADHDIKYKITQAKLAEQLEEHHNKTWILDSYLNHVPYGGLPDGQQSIGVGAAAEMFFSKPVWKLDLAQLALLAGLPQAPGAFDPFEYSALAHHRQQQVLQSMVDAKYITQTQADNAAHQPFGLNPNASYTEPRLPYVFDYVVEQLKAKLCGGMSATACSLRLQGLKVYTTINPQTQDEAVADLQSRYGGANLDAQPGGALSSVDPSNGHILAIASSANYNQTTFDYATQGNRQTGSAFKIFALMTLIHDYDGDPNKTYYTSKFLPAGWLPEDPTWSVHTAEDSYQGVINITKATIVSDNTVFAQLAVDIGPAKMDAMAHAMGITSTLNDLPAEVIGGLKEGVTTLQMADAYATIANGGWHIPPTILTKVVFPDGSVENFGDPPRTQVFSYADAYEAISVMKQVITSGTGTAANYGCPAAGKTGTANNLDNAWFVGFSPKVSTAVWVGYPQGNLPMADGFGGTLAAPVWRQFMLQVSNGYCGDWAPPEVPFVGTAFVGPHSSVNVPVTQNNGTTGTGAQTYTNSTGYTAPSQNGGTGIGAAPPVQTGGAGQGPGGGQGNGSGQTGGGGQGATQPGGGGTG